MSTGIRRAAQALDRPLLQHPQQLDLYFERQVTDLIEKNRRVIGELEAAGLARQRSRKRAPFAAEELAFDERRRDRRAVHPHHRTRVARAELVDLSREQFLSRPGLANQQDRRVGRRHLPDLRQHSPDGRALPMMRVTPSRSAPPAAKTFSAAVIPSVPDFLGGRSRHAPLLLVRSD